MNRREFLLAAAVAPRAMQSLTSEGWRIFEVATHVHVQNASGTTRVWLPTPLVGAPYQQTLGDTYNAEHGRVVMVESDELDLLLAEWTDGADPVVDLTSRVATRACAVDLAKPTVEPPADFAAFARFLRPTFAYRLDEAFKAKAATVAGKGTDLERARRIFAWSRTEDAPGRSALLVAGARAVGIPARVLSGLRLDSADATRAQSTRAEVYLVGFGWVPVDAAANAFGAWDGDWIAFNSAQDVPLPKTKHGVLPFFMHPQAETANGFSNGLDPSAFRYDISVRASA
jgi:Transglutaminase-like superfamily